MKRMNMQTKNKARENFEKLMELFPNAVTEAIVGQDEEGENIIERSIDADILRQEISEYVVEGKEERYQFTWPDKKKSMLLANAPINATLRPIREDSVNFDTTENLYIEGDNLDILKLLQETYLGKVKMIYIDPPYNTGKNYIYKNDYTRTSQEYFSNSYQFDDEGNRLFRNLETNGRFHTDWLNMMYPRLKLAKDLLRDDGVLVCAIDQNEISNLASILKEIFGELGYEHSYVSVVHNPRGQQGKNFSYVNEYLIFIYPNDGEKYISDIPKDEIDSRNLRDSGSESDRKDAKSCFYPFIVKDNKIIEISDVPDNSYHPKNCNVIRDDGTLEIWPMTDSGDEKKWRYSRQSINKILDKLEIRDGRNFKQVIFNKDTGTMRSVWDNSKYDASEYGTKLLDRLFDGESGFSYPKSLWAVYDAVKSIVEDDKDAIILDFFSGSATTAHSVMQINSEDDGNRKYIMIQLPEDLDETMKNSDMETGKQLTKAIQVLDNLNKPHIISEIGKERIRRAGKKIKEEYPDAKFDDGFRVLRLDSTNMKGIYYKPHEIDQNFLDSLENNIKEDRTPEDLLFQIMLDLGVLLSSPIMEREIEGKKVYSVADGFLIACFDEDISDEVVKSIAKEEPYYAVFKDGSMANDSTMSNFEQIFETYSPSTVRRVL